MTIGIWVLYIVFFMGIVPFLALYFGKGAESIAYLQKTWTYYAIGAITMIGVTALVLMKRYGLKFGYGFIFSPEDGWLGRMKEFSFLRSPLKVFFISIIFASVLGLVGAMSNTAWTGIPVFEQQVTEGAEISMAVEPASSSEATMELFILFLALSFVFFIAKRYKLGKNFTIPMSLFVAIPIRCLFAVAIHALRYGNIEGNLVGIFLLRYFNSIITLATGNVIFEYVWHQTNNLFVKLNEMFANDIILIVTLLVLGAILLLGATIWFRTSMKKKGKVKLTHIWTILGVLFIGTSGIYFSSFFFTEQSIVGLDYSIDCTEGIDCQGTGCCYALYGGDKATAVAYGWRSVGTNDYDTTCSGCYFKHPAPYSCYDVESNACWIEQEMLGKIAEGYKDCSMKTDYQRTNGHNTAGYACFGCPDGMVKNQGYITYDGKEYPYGASCIEPECESGQKETKDCGNGTEIMTKECKDYLWADTGAVCCAEGDLITEICSEDLTIIRYRCTDDYWDSVSSCPEVEEESGTESEESAEEVPQEEESQPEPRTIEEEEVDYTYRRNPYIIAGLSIALIVIGVLLYFYYKKK